MPTIERVAVDGSLMDVHVYKPAQREAAPLILLMYPRSGLDGFPQRIAAAFAAEGFRVAVPEISHRQDPTIPIRDRKQFLKDTEIVDDIRATLTLFQRDDGTKANNAFIMGHCMGGHHAFLGASCIPGIAGAVPYYSADMFERRGEFRGLRSLSNPAKRAQFDRGETTPPVRSGGRGALSRFR